MNQAKDWIIPVISFCTFIAVLIVVILFTYEKITFSKTKYQEPEVQQQVTNVQDFQKALNSSLKQ